MAHVGTPWLYTAPTMREWQKAYVESLVGVRQAATVRAKRHAIDKLLTYLESQGIGYKELDDSVLQSWVQWMSQDAIAPSSIRLHVSHARNFLLWCRRRGLDIKATGEDLILPRMKKKVTAVLREQALKTYMVAARELDEPTATAIQLLPLLGLRSGEIVKLRLQDLKRSKGVVYFLVTGKSKTDRLVPMMPVGKPLLGRYLANVRPRLGDSDWLFPSPLNPKRNLSARTLQDRMAKIRRELNIDHLTPHLIRHTYATMLAESGITTLDLQRILGHENPGTTSRYYHQSEQHAASQVARVNTSWADEDEGNNQEGNA